MSMGKNNSRFKGKNPNKKIQDDFVPQGNEEALKTPVEQLKLSERTLEALKNGGVLTCHDICVRRMQEMYRIQNINKKSCLEIQNALKKLGLSYRPDDTQNENKPNNKPNNKQVNARENKLKKMAEVNKKLNDSLTKMYQGLTIDEILNGKRERPKHNNQPQKAKLTPESIVKFCRKGKWGYKDYKGNVLIQPVYQEAFAFSEGLACVEKDEKIGFINEKGEIVIDYQYDTATSFSEGLAAVTLEEKTGYIDKEGNWVIKPLYDIATPFVEDKAIVMLDKRWGVLSKNGEVFWR